MSDTLPETHHDARGPCKWQAHAEAKSGTGASTQPAASYDRGTKYSNSPTRQNCDSISERAKMRKREHLHVLLNRGSKLEEKLAKELSLGIYSAQQFGEQCDPG
jgi:hypothetical protein